ncbi:MAG: glycosyltransferase family 2 protein [Rhizobacter sp.]|nr:glycosyltransferase family 2 protein [Ferruginibacter sp.]
MNNHQQNNTGKLPEVAVVILNWNGKKFLEQFLPSVTGSSYANKRIIVADNASADDSVPFVRANYPQVEILQNNNNDGFAKGYNVALKQVRSDYYVLLNSDVEVTQGWIEPVIDLMESDQSIAVCQPKLLAFDNKTQFEYAGASGGWIDNLGYPFARGRVFENCEKDKGQYNEAQECFWASGAALFIKAKVYHDLGGLDEYFFAHQEEIDLCWRIKLSGYKIYVQPASVVYHVGGGTLPKGNSRKTYLNFRNNLIMLHKNLSTAERIKKIPLRFLLDGIAAWKALFSGDGGYFIAILKAHFHVIKWILFHQKESLFVADKKIIQSGIYNGSIVWDHFIKKKKTFFEIVGNK